MAKMGPTVSHIDGRKQNMKNFLKVRQNFEFVENNEMSLNFHQESISTVINGS